MDHLYQTTMLLPASYAVISEEEMTYIEGGAITASDATAAVLNFAILAMYLATTSPSIPISLSSSAKALLSMRSFWAAAIPSVISKILLSAEPTMVCPRLAPSITLGIS